MLAALPETTADLIADPVKGPPSCGFSYAGSPVPAVGADGGNAEAVPEGAGGAQCSALCSTFIPSQESCKDLSPKKTSPTGEH